MAAMDFVRTEWGIVAGGTGVDATAVASGRLRVKLLAFAGNADNATCTLTTDSGSGTAIDTFKFKSGGEELDAALRTVYFGEQGVPMSNLTVTMSHANDRLYIYLT